jgi:hypothetical protein
MCKICPFPFPLFPSTGSSVSSPSASLSPPRFSRQSDRTRQNCLTYMQDHLTSLFRLTAGPYFEKHKHWFSVLSMGLGRKNSSRKDVFASQSSFLVAYYCYFLMGVWLYNILEICVWMDDTKFLNCILSF